MEGRIRAGGPGWECDLQVGATYTIGRTSSAGPVDLQLGADERIHRIAGLLDVHDVSWEIRNVGRWLSLLVVDLDGPGRDVISPGGRSVFGWPRVRIEVDLGDATPSLTIERSQARADRPPGAFSSLDDTSLTIQVMRLDRASGYFRTLVALCEPRLRDPSSQEIPTDLQIVARLNGCGVEERRISAKTVERRLDHCRSRVGLKAEDGVGAGLERRDARRRLVEFVLHGGFVTVSDLQLLQPGAGG